MQKSTLASVFAPTHAQTSCILTASAGYAGTCTCNTQTHKHTPTPTPTCTHTHAHAHMHAHTHTHTSTQAHRRTHTHAHIRTHTCTHTQAHAKKETGCSIQATARAAWWFSSTDVGNVTVTGCFCFINSALLTPGCPKSCAGPASSAICVVCCSVYFNVCCSVYR